MFYVCEDGVIGEGVLIFVMFNLLGSELSFWD